MAPSIARTVLERFYAAERAYMGSGGPNGGDFSSMAACLSPDYVLVQTPDLPYGGTYTGHEGFKRWAETMSSYFDRLDVQGPSVFLEADGEGDKVVVYSTVVVRASGSGEELTTPMVQVITVDTKKELITEMRPFYWNVQGWVGVIERGQKALEKA